MKKHLSTILLFLMFLAGLSLLLYPTVSDYYNSFHQSRAIARYAQSVSEMENVDYDGLLEQARAYNQALAANPDRWILNDQERQGYEGLLNLTGSGMMGYVEIPKLDLSLPIYHGTDEAVLQIAVGHIEGSSLPVGGTGTHTVLSGHRGLPSAKLFTNLDELVTGDTFLLQVLDETLTYEVDQILIVEPDDLDALSIDPEEDYCTLVTCTPYGINTHRLLVRGHRIETAEDSTVRVTADAMQIEPVLVAPAIAVPILLVLLLWLLISTRGASRRGSSKKQK